MTVRVTTLKGADAGAYYVEQLPNYYLDSGEPRGVWLGDGAPMLGLAGEVDDDAFLACMAGMDPQRPDRHLGGRYDDKSVRGFDVTASAPKSVSVLFALGDDDIRREVLDAHDAAVARARRLDRAARPHPLPDRRRGRRRRRRGDRRRRVPAAHQPRARPAAAHPPGDRQPGQVTRRPLARARRPTIKRDQRTLSALYHAGLRAELTERLGVRWNDPEHGIAEIADVPDGAARRVLRSAPPMCAGGSTRSSTASSTRWAASPRHGSGGGSNARQRSTAAPPRPTRSTPMSLHAQWAEQVRAARLRADTSRRGRDRPRRGTRRGSTASTATRDRGPGDR